MYLQRQIVLSETTRQSRAAKKAAKAAKKANPEAASPNGAPKSQNPSVMTSTTRENGHGAVTQAESSMAHPTTAAADKATPQKEFTVIGGYKLENGHDALRWAKSASAHPQTTNANDAAVQNNIGVTRKVMSERGRFSLECVTKAIKACLRKAIGRAAAAKNNGPSGLDSGLGKSRRSILNKLANPYSRIQDAAPQSDDEQTETQCAAEIGQTGKLRGQAHLLPILEVPPAESPAVSTHRRFSWENSHDSFELTVARVADLSTGNSDIATTSNSQASSSRVLLETYRDSLELTRETKPHLVAAKEDDTPTPLDSIAELAECPPETYLQPLESRQATKAGLFSESVDDAAASSSISLSLHHEVAMGQERLASVAESNISLLVNENTTLQKLRYMLQRRAAEMAFDDDTQAGEVFGFILIVNDGETEPLVESTWASRKDWMRSARLEYRFQVLTLDDSVDRDEGECAERTSEFDVFA